jgi:hypothetical protein
MTTDVVRGGWRAASAAGSGLLLAAVLPKCPLCAAVLLSALGLGGVLPVWFAPWLRVGLALATSLIVLTLWAAATRGQRRSGQCSGCSDGRSG